MHRYARKVILANEHKDTIYAVVFEPDGELIASGDADGRIVVWSPTSGQARHRIMAPNGASIVSLSWPIAPRGLLAGTSDGCLLIIDIGLVSHDHLTQVCRTTDDLVPGLDFNYCCVCPCSSESLRVHSSQY